MKRLSLLLLLVCSMPLMASDYTGPTTPDNEDTAETSLKKIGKTLSKSATGTANETNSQVTASTTASTLVIARATRHSCLIKNTDASITVYIGAPTVTAGNGMPLKPGESVPVTAITLWQVIAASGTPVVAVIDEYD